MLRDVMQVVLGVGALGLMAALVVFTGFFFEQRKGVLEKQRAERIQKYPDQPPATPVPVALRMSAMCVGGVFVIDVAAVVALTSNGLRLEIALLCAIPLTYASMFLLFWAARRWLHRHEGELPDASR
jgi:hypothetical protein